MVSEVAAGVVVVGSGIRGISAAIAAHALGLRPLVLEKGDLIGGASAASGGQVWVGANHLMDRLGLDDTVEEALAYVHALTQDDQTIFEPDVARQWLDGARVVAQWFEDRGVITWEIVPGYHDYFWPDAPGAKAEGRYLTGALFAGGQLSPDRARLIPAPQWPVGITYGEMFSWGGQASKTAWDWDLVRRRRAEDMMTFGQGIMAAFLTAAFARGIEVRSGQRVTRLLTEGDAVVGVLCTTVGGDVEVRGPVILASGAHDWWDEAERYTRIPRGAAGSVAPRTLTGDGMALGEAVGAEVRSVPSWAAPVVPGYQLPRPEFDGDTGFRTCWEQSMPHAILVDRRGARFCDDAFYPAVARALLTPDDSGALLHLPFFMVWDAAHHARYGLGSTPPGEPYPQGLVESADTPAALARALGIDPEGLVRTLERFNAGAAQGQDPDFGRGTNPATERFRGDLSHPLNPNTAPVTTPPLHGMRMRLVSTGITAAGVRSGLHGRALRADGSAIAGLHAVGECSARSAGGSGYNSGYSLSRAMTFGWLAAHDVASRRSSTGRLVDSAGNASRGG